MKIKSTNSSLKIAINNASSGKVVNNLTDSINTNISGSILQQDFCRNAMENAPFAIGFLDTNGNLVQGNATLQSWLNKTVGKPLASSIHSEDAPLFKRALKRAVELGHSYSDMEIRLICTNEQVRWAAVSIKSLSNGQIAIYMNDINRRKKTENELLNLANTDHLTSLSNRMIFDNALKNSVKNASRYNRQGAVLYIDLNDFKKINDTHGHKAGDSLLIEIGKILQNLFRETDIVARIGGDEFAVLMEEVSSPQAKFKGQAVERAIRNLQIEAHNNHVGCTASVGVKVFNGENVKTVEDIVIAADKAMYDRKIEVKLLHA